MRHLAIECGMDPHDGLIVAVLPVLDDLMEEYAFEGGTGFAKDGVLIDVVPNAGDTMKWWRVKQAANITRNRFGINTNPEGLSVPQPVWYGPAGEFTMECVPERFRDSLQLHMRSYTRGPWIALNAPIALNAAESKSEATDDSV